MNSGVSVTPTDVEVNYFSLQVYKTRQVHTEKTAAETQQHTEYLKLLGVGF